METTTKHILDTLSNQPDPIIRWKARRYHAGQGSIIAEQSTSREELKSSPVLVQLLTDQRQDGSIPYHPYDKWFGAHWVLSILADLGYPEGDESLKPLLDQCYAWLLSAEHQKHIRMINGRVRRCASQEGNCVYYSLSLGLADDRTEELVNRLLQWQWVDGGWNCDKRPEASKSSFNETLIPLRGLSCYVKYTGDPKAQRAMQRAADVFLKRNLIHRISDGRILDRNFVLLHYPNYWHYDILFALKVMLEAGYLLDPRCTEALDMLESKRLSDGGFPAEAKYYRVDDKKLSGHSRVDWGGVSKIHSNPFVSLDALNVLVRSHRLTE
jgi:hypothetical protein